MAEHAGAGRRDGNMAARMTTARYISFSRRSAYCRRYRFLPFPPNAREGKSAAILFGR